jgi:hypothetical protein
MTAPGPVQEALEPTSEVVRILEEYLEELEAGARLNPEDLAARCPELAGPLKACLASLEFLQDAALSLRGPGQTGPPPAAAAASRTRPALPSPSPTAPSRATRPSAPRTAATPSAAASTTRRGR